MMINIVGTAVVIAIVVVIGLYLDQKFGVKPEELEGKNKGNISARINRQELLRKSGQVDINRRVPVATTVGDTPATAIRAGASQLANLRAAQRCKDCRAVLEADGPDEELRYDSRPLLLLHFRCPSCVRKRSLYVIPMA